MRFAMLLTALCLIVCGTAQAATKTTRKLTERITATYDRFDDETRVSTEPMKLYSDSTERDDTRLRFRLVFRCPGDSLDRPDHVSIVFEYSGPTWRYLSPSDHELVFLVDDRRLPIADVGHEGKVFSSWVTEWMLAMFQPEEVIALITSDTNGRLGMTEFSLRTPSNVATLDEFAALLRRRK